MSRLNKKIAQIKTKHLLVENELNTLKTFDSSCFIGKSHFEEDGTQTYLVFQPINKYFKVITSDNSLSPALSYYGTKTRVKFTGSCLKQ